ncbi:hypothetical protein HRG84_22110 [Flavisolibacter sp. BT320]|nr:hypothetical protein [Flavisolibacter longurius]
MSRPSIISKCILRKKIATLVLVTVSVAAFASLIDGGRQGKKNNDPVLLPYSAKDFSLRSNYNYRSNNLFSKPEKKEFIMLNPMITYQKGNAAYILPLKKMPLLGKIRFAPPQK